MYVDKVPEKYFKLYSKVYIIYRIILADPVNFVPTYLFSWIFSKVTNNFFSIQAHFNFVQGRSVQD